MRYRHLRYPDFRTKAFSMSFDDGLTDDFRLVEIMNKHGLKGTFNINSETFCTDPSLPWPRKLTLEEAKGLYYPSGHEVAVHGLHHISPYLSTPPKRIHELLEDRIALEADFDRIVLGMAMPDDGRCTPEMIEQFRMLGFHFSRGLGYSEAFLLPDDFLKMGPTAKFNQANLFERLDRFLAVDPNAEYISHRDPLFFLMWGHAHELRAQDNWQIIEDVGERMEAHPEVWLANNSEIAEYVLAYRSIISSADDHILYNPTQTKIWLEVDKENYVLEPGATLHLH